MCADKNEADTRKAVQTVKAQIQRNEAGLNLKRLHTYVVVQAHRASPDAIETDNLTRLRGWLAGDFAVPDMNLCVLLYESLEPYEGEDMEYNTRMEQTRAFLSALPGLSASFARTFLLSDRNERDTVHPSHWPLIYETLTRLPSVHTTDSRLYESLEAKTIGEGTLLYLTAGIELDATDIPAALSDIISPSIPFHEITDRMMSVAANPIGITKLRGLTLAEAERALFGSRAEMFYTGNFATYKSAGAVPDVPPDNRLIKAWRVCTVIKKIAEAYAGRYQRHYRQAMETARRSNDKPVFHVRSKNAEPPPCALSLIRWDGLPEEVYRFTEGGPCVLRIVGGFNINDLRFMNNNISITPLADN